MLKQLCNAGKWREHPVAVTMYSYMFGAIFMGIASLYFVIKKRTSEFVIPQEVSTLMYQPIVYYNVKSPNLGANIINFGTSLLFLFFAVSLCSCLCCVHQFCPLLSPNDLVQSSSLVHTGHFLLASAGNSITHFYQIICINFEQLVYGISTRCW